MEVGGDVVGGEAGNESSTNEVTSKGSPTGNAPNITKEFSTTSASASTKTKTASINLKRSVPGDEYMTVVKRNGMLVPFRRDRIATAVEAAFRAVKGISITEPLPHDTYTTVQSVTDEVVTEARARARQGSSLTVEGIQDLVEEKLMHTGHYDVARSYIIYRDEHKALRDDSPRNLKVFRRDGKTLVRFNPMKIASAIEKAFRAAHHVEGPTPQNLIDAVNLVANKVVNRAVQMSKEGQNLHVELLQDEVERQMMAEGFFREAKDFIIYRAKRAEVRALEEEAAASAPSEEVQIERRQLVLETVGREFHAQDERGQPVIVREGELRRRIEFACRDHKELVSADVILDESLKNFYEGIKISEVDTCNIFAARSRIEKEPAYSYVTARLLLDVIYRETLGLEAHDPELTQHHREYFHEYLKKAISVERLSPDLLNFDLKKIAAAIDLSRDLNFTYLGLQTLYDRYLIHHEDRRLETPQIFWMRVAMGLAVNEGEAKNEKAIEFYNVLSRFLFTSSTPTLFNAGTLHPQLSSCYLTTVKDDLKHIFKCVQDDALLSKWAGGLGNDWTSVRATGARIKGTNGRSQGVIPFLKVANDTAVAVNQGGKRKGAMCAYLETWHLDVEDFLELRKNTGDERRRTHDMNTANWIPDLFMKRVAERGMWTLFSPSDVPDLHDLYGQAFEKRYLAYEQMVERGEMKLFKKIEALSLWRKMLSMLFETGHPWITFKDPSNLRSPQDHVGVVHSSNLCTEILLNTSENETAVCNLGSVNLATHCTPNGLDQGLLEKTIRTAVRMLDNVIDINFYPTAEAKNANLKHRPVGLGIMGFQDALYIQGFSYASPEAVRFADQSMEVISFFAILASTELAAERGAYPSYEGSKWQRGLLPIDTLSLLVQERGEQYVDVDVSVSLDWAPVRSAIKTNGMRNSNVMAIAPTATISNITGVSQSIEPEYKHLFVKSNLSGEFIVHNTYLVDELKKHGIWDEQMVDDLKYFDGSITEIERIPEEVRRKFLTAFEIEPEWLLECASRRQKWIDMGQSLNLYISEPNGKKLHDMYLLAWRKALKTTYYLRSLAATQIEKSTTDINKRGLQPRWMKSKSASADVQVSRETATTEQTPKSAALPKAVCNLDGDCESCQ